MHLIKIEKDNCQPCNQVSDYLDSKGVTYQSINAFNNPELAMKFYKGRSVPALLLLNFHDEVVQTVVGFKPEEIDKLIAEL